GGEDTPRRRIQGLHLARVRGEGGPGDRGAEEPRALPEGVRGAVMGGALCCSRMPRPVASPRAVAWPRPVASPRPPRLMDQVRLALGARRYSRRTEKAYCHWIKRFIFFHGLRHPSGMAATEVNAFLSHLALAENVSASTQNQALSALLFLYRHVLSRELGDPGEVGRARGRRRL